VRLGKKDATMSFVIQKAQTYDPDPAHNETVTTLALGLFDSLQALHGYGPPERLLLEIAGRLHDIGWSRVVSGKHHKLSGAMVLDLPIPGLDEPDQLTTALIARYHTRALPDASRHRRFASLDPARRELVEWLAGMLRLADGLDSSHAQVVQRLACEYTGKAITIYLEGSGDCRMEVEGARKKQDLLERKTRRKIAYRW
jgi:exopolyphosphatase/guanosine-5'-triphosphate,3'-diphosphate pyrophosphatase